MKQLRTISLVSLASACWLAGLLHAADVVSVPVGFVRNEVKAGSDALISPILYDKPAFVGTIAAVVDGDTLQVAGTPAWSAAAFSGAGNEHLLILLSGDREGLVAKISANGTDTLDLTFPNEDLGTVGGDQVTVGDKVQIVPAWALAELLPDDGSTPDGTAVFLYDQARAGTDKAATEVFLLATGEGWYSGPTNGDDRVILPHESIMVRAPGATAFDVVQVGTVANHSVRIPIATTTGAQDFRLQSTMPVPVEVTTLIDPGSAADGDTILIYDNAATGENKAPVLVATYTSGSGWSSGGSTLIQPGQGFVYRRQASAAALPVTHTPSYLPLAPNP